MYRIFLSGLLATACFLSATAQSLYKPRNIRQAFENGTRSEDGRPGKNYWQNSGRYDITVTAAPPDRTIRGTEGITYFNNSPDTLHTLVMRLVNNIHKPAAPRGHYVPADFLTSGVHIDSFYIDRELQEVNSDGWGTAADVPLPQPLLPRDSVRLRIAWHYDMSVLSGREGRIDSTTFYVAYCYPRVSVYDDYNGWDRIPHMDRTEFYNDFNDYTLQVKVPANYVVWATGTLQNPEEVLQPEIAKRLERSFQSDDVIHVATLQEMLQHKITAQNEWNTWKWTAADITDMTLALSDHYVWDAASVVVDDAGRRVSMQAAYNDTAEDFHHSVAFGTHALQWFSRNWPGVAYPYPKMTAFQGYADMEYPMMVNDATTNDLEFSQMVQDHEIAHTYFPFYMGTNETRYAFMDEGWATTFEYLIGQTENGKEKAVKTYRQFRVNRWIHDPSTEEDQPIISMSTQVSGMGYGSNAYVKPSLAYLALKDLLGDVLFKKSLHEYMARWHGKHPIPWDFFNSISSASGKNLNWFWNNWFFSNNYIDLTIDKVKKTSKGYAVSIKNTGGFAVPVELQITYTDGSSETLHQTPGIWQADQKQARVDINTRKKMRSVTLDGGIFIDADRKDDKWISR